MIYDMAALPPQAHPAPHRGRVGALALAFATMAAPLAWSVHLLMSYAIASHACFPGDMQRLAPPADSVWLWSLLVAIDLITIAIAFAAALVAYRIWRSTRHESPGPAGTLIEVGEGRTRFLSIWGMLISAGFLVAIVFDLIGVWVLPSC
jgi:hypothetical protein